MRRASGTRAVGDRAYNRDRVYTARRHPAADHVEPPDRRRRGAGADDDPHRLLHHRARGGRSLRRHLRPPRPDARASRHRHAGPRQFHDGERRTFPREIPGGNDARGRPLHHQRSLARHRPSPRPDGREPGVPPGPDRRAVRQYRACHRHRRARHGPGRALGVRGRPLYPDRQMLRGGTGERDVLRFHSLRLAAAGRARGRRLFALRLQRRRRPPARSADGRIRDGEPRGARRIHFREQPARYARRDRKTAEGRLAFADPLRRLRGAGDARGGDDDCERTRSRSTSPARRGCPRAGSTCPPPIAAPMPRSASRSWSRRRYRTIGRA